METRSITIINPNGLHLRVASDIVKICRKYTSIVRLSCCGDAEADGRSILSIVELGITVGTVLTLSVDGPDACEALDELSRYLSSGTEYTATAIAAVKEPTVCHSA